MDTVRNQAGIPYVTANAILRCPFGLMTSILNVVDPTRPSIGFNKMATIQDRHPINIPPFGMCTSILNPEVEAATALALGTLTPAPCPCVQAMMGWSLAPNNVVSKSSYYLDQTCTLLCSFGGNIMIVHSGQGVSAPVPVPCKPLESNYELPEWLDDITTIAQLSPFGLGLDIVESIGDVKQGKYGEAIFNLVPLKKLKKGGKLLGKPVNKILEKTAGTNTEKITQKVMESKAVQAVKDKIDDIANSDTMKSIADSNAGKKVSQFVNSKPGKKTGEYTTDVAENVSKNGVKGALFGEDGAQGYSDNKDIAQAATGLPTDEFDKYTDYGGSGNSGGSR